MKWLGNSKGFSLTGAMIGAAIGMVVIAGLANLFANFAKKTQRVESRLVLFGHLLEIQHRTAVPESCEEIIGANTKLDLNKLKESFKDTKNPGSPVSLTLFNGTVLESNKNNSASSKPLDGAIEVEHLAFTNGVDTGRLGPNGFTLYQAVLFGAFSNGFGGTNRVVSAKPITTLFLEIDPGGGDLATCFGGNGSQETQKELICRNFGAQWDPASESCEVMKNTIVEQGPGPLGTDPTGVPKPEVTNGLGAGCGAGAPPGKVKVTSISSMQFGGQQCINGKWVKI